MFGVKGFAKGLAKAQLRSFLAARRKHPDAAPEELYFMALSTRPGYDQERISHVIELANSITNPTNFQMVVIVMAQHEFSDRTGYDLKLKERQKIRDVVEKVIPPNI